MLLVRYNVIFQMTKKHGLIFRYLLINKHLVIVNHLLRF